jgi:hypothetical protein
MKTQDLCALWGGGSLSYIERLCLTSMLDTGHKVALYTYDGVPNAPAGVDMRDGREVMPQTMMVSHAKLKSVAIGSDLFRYRLLQKELGCWVDTDMLFLKPLRSASHIFGYETSESINNAVLKLPPDSPILADIMHMVERVPIIPPWWPVRKKVEQWGRWIAGKSRGIERMKWATTGPRAVTHFANKHRLQGYAMPIDVFYPNPWEGAFDVFDLDVDIDERFTGQTIGVHLWNTEIRRLKIFTPPAGSFIDRHCKRLGIEHDSQIGAPRPALSILRS